MGRDLYRISAIGFIFWLLLGLNIMVLVVAFLVDYILLWLLSLSIPFTVLAIDNHRKEKSLQIFFRQKYLNRKKFKANKIHQFSQKNKHKTYEHAEKSGCDNRRRLQIN